VSVLIDNVGALVTNDVSLFLLVPLTRVLAEQAHLPLARLVVLEALAVNAGSALTPIGNPQNLYLWHRSSESFGGFVAMMAPTVAVMLVWVVVAVWWLVPRTPIALKELPDDAPVVPRLLWLSGALFVGFVVALDRHWLPAGLAGVFGALLVCYPRVLRAVDWALLAIIALMFIDLRQLASLPSISQGLQQAPIDAGWRGARRSWLRGGRCCGAHLEPARTIEGSRALASAHPCPSPKPTSRPRSPAPRIPTPARTSSPASR